MHAKLYPMHLVGCVVLKVCIRQNVNVHICTHSMGYLLTLPVSKTHFSIATCARLTCTDQGLPVHGHVH